jgi:ribose/xylose/arabinose/galactoside ABC-type transport system permease subunit
MTIDASVAMERTTYPWRRILFRPETPTAVFLVLVIAAFSGTVDRFLTTNNISSIIDGAAVTAIVALAMNQLVLAGEIDISVGSMLGVCAYAVGLAAESTGGLVLPLLAGVAAGGLIAAVNATLVTLGRIPSIIVTLGALYALRGLLLTWGGAIVIDLPQSSRVLGVGEIAGVPMPVVLLAVIWLVFEAMSRHSAWGRDVLAVGGNPTAAKFAGLRIRWVKWRAFLLLGLVTGFAAVVYLGQVGSAQASIGNGFELQVLAAVVIGGTSISGGRGSTIAPVIGSLLIAVVLNGMTLMGISDRFAQLVFGLLILVAVSIDPLLRRLTKDPS